ncbi:hypothetical protein FACS1894200_07700 [Spirochaetia bacterium]|nr:hypothetical protein FACS1894200_07700 [Spirochaetia bacterium]
MTVRQTIDIPANREVHLDFVVPETVPCGRRDIIMDFPQEPSPHEDWRSLYGFCKSSGDTYTGIQEVMSNTELLLKEIEGLPPNSIGEILDFVGYIKHRSPQKQGLGKKPPVDQTLAEIWKLCKDVPISVDSFLEERHAERDREYEDLE